MLSTKLKEAAGNSADATLYVDDVFSTYLYTGNGSTQTITNDIDLAGKGGLVWIKSRSAATDNKLTDTVRGATKALISNTTGAETTDTTGLTAFSSTGFSLGASSVYNTNAATYVSWTFREAAKFFDVVTYTGTGSPRNIAHSLGVAPGMIIVKRTDSALGWPVYHRGLTSLDFLLLDSASGSSSAGSFWDDTNPTATNFTVGSSNYTNASGGSYVAYLFAHDTSADGIIQCGSFTTDGSGSATVTLGYEPQWVMIKRSDASDDWIMLDVMRGMSFSTCLKLAANASSAEYNFGANQTYPNATGFTVNGTLSASGTYIYIAIRRSNKPPTSGTQVYIPLAAKNLVNTINTTNFPIDLQWYGNRAGHVGNIITVDRLRGVATTDTQQQNYLKTSSTGAEINSGGSDYTNSWNNTGFKTSYAADGANAVYWNFKRAPGFFDEVCYTGTGSATTQAHNLGVAPELMIVKSRSDALDWSVYVSSLTPAQYLMLNNTAPSLSNTAFWNNTTPTSTVFSIGAQIAVNYSSYTYVAYLFATLAGISKVGSYTGNGTGQAIACGFSAGARFVLIKRTDDAGNWYTFDSARGLTSGSSPYLLLNSTAAEVTGNNGVYASTGGFTLDATAITTTNIATANYIFLAVS